MCQFFPAECAVLLSASSSVWHSHVASTRWTSCRITTWIGVFQSIDVWALWMVTGMNQWHPRAVPRAVLSHQDVVETQTIRFSVVEWVYEHWAPVSSRGWQVSELEIVVYGKELTAMIVKPSVSAVPHFCSVANSLTVEEKGEPTIKHMHAWAFEIAT